jgi:hypothetical protein
MAHVTVIKVLLNQLHQPIPSPSSHGVERLSERLSTSFFRAA